MTKADRNSLVALPIVVVIGAAVALAGSSGGARVGAIPVVLLCAALAFVIQWVAYVPAYHLQSERFYDLTGSATFLSVTLLAVVLTSGPTARTYLLLAVVAVWALRLGFYLSRRVGKAGADSRFDEIKPLRFRFLLTWTLQGLWVTITLAPALAAITSGARPPLGVLGVAGLVVWAGGFALEVAADVQKSRFRADPANRGRFISTGVWAWCRHPNYLGEIVLWVGVALMAAPALRGWQWATMVSPVFVFLLITRVSGVPLLEKKADERWGGREDYEAYKARTPVLVPRPFAAGGGRERR